MQSENPAARPFGGWTDKTTTLFHPDDDPVSRGGAVPHVDPHLASVVSPESHALTGITIQSGEGKRGWEAGRNGPRRQLLVSVPIELP